MQPSARPRLLYVLMLLSGDRQAEGLQRGVARTIDADRSQGGAARVLRT
jgi:hypothetical protein